MGVSVPRCVLSAAVVMLLAPASAWGWSSPTDLSPHTDFDQTPSVGTNPRGDEAVAWEREIDPYHSEINATVRPAGGTWSSVQTLSLAADWQNMNPSVAVDAHGDTLVVWGATDGGGTRAAFAPAGQPFQSAVPVGGQYNGSDGNAYTFVSFDDAGNAIAFWLDPDNRVYYATRPAGGSFGPAAQVPHAASDSAASWPSYAVAGNGDAVAVWRGTGAEYAVIRNANGTFDAPQALDTAAQSGPPHVAMDAAGDAIAVWAVQVNNQGYMKAAIRPAGASSFGAPTTIAEVSYGGNNEASVAMDSAGDGTIVWPGESSSPYVNDGPTAVVHRAGQAGFGPPEPLGGPGALEPPQVAYDAAGDAYAVWRQYDTNTTTSVTGRVWAEEAPAGRPFPAAPVAISGGQYNVWPPALAAGAGGSAAAVWPIGVFNGDASQFWIQEADTFTSASITATAGTPVASAPPGVGALGSTGATGTTGRNLTVDAAAAASSCAGERASRRRLGAAVGTRVVSCIVRVERSQLGLGYAQSGRLSRMVARALARFVSLGRKQRLATERTATTGMLRSICRTRRPRLAFIVADSRSPLTPLSVARLLAQSLSGRNSVDRASGAVFGIAARSGLLFARRPRTGTSLAIVAAACA